LSQTKESIPSVKQNGLPLINLDHPRYGLWLRIAGGVLLACASGLSLIFVDLVVRMKLSTGVDVVDAVLPFVLGICLAWIVVAAAVAVGVDALRA